MNAATLGPLSVHAVAATGVKPLIETVALIVAVISLLITSKVKRLLVVSVLAPTPRAGSEPVSSGASSIALSTRTGAKCQLKSCKT